mmetsp:Transcript_52001/g.101829  ORF Transcript_52001/g.101829 Transcript_52001/m.101829 type:complete len:213 (-) Transcript_52001:1118-1756(-)
MHKAQAKINMQARREGGQDRISSKLKNTASRRDYSMHERKSLTHSLTKAGHRDGNMCVCVCVCNHFCSSVTQPFSSLRFSSPSSSLFHLIELIVGARLSFLNSPCMRAHSFALNLLVYLGEGSGIASFGRVHRERSRVGASPFHGLTPLLFLSMHTSHLFKETANVRKRLEKKRIRGRGCVPSFKHRPDFLARRHKQMKELDATVSSLTIHA